MFAAELQRRAAVQLLDLRQVGLGPDHHARRLTVHEVLLLSGGRSEGGRSGGREEVSGEHTSGGKICRGSGRQNAGIVDKTITSPNFLFDT